MKCLTSSARATCDLTLCSIAILTLVTSTACHTKDPATPVTNTVTKAKPVTASKQTHELSLPPACQAEHLPQHGLDSGLLTLESGTTIRLRMANSSRQRQVGLMCETQLAKNEGMLFTFKHEQVQSFWMKNTILPLDMIFIDANKQVVGIIENTQPLSTESRSVGKPSLYVLELNAGMAKVFGIQVNQTLHWESL